MESSFFYMTIFRIIKLAVFLFMNCIYYKSMSFFKKIFSKEKKETLDKGLEKTKTQFFSQT